jgi:hypothetical protein
MFSLKKNKSPKRISSSQKKSFLNFFKKEKKEDDNNNNKFVKKDGNAAEAVPTICLPIVQFDSDGDMPIEKRILKGI